MYRSALLLMVAFLLVSCCDDNSGEGRIHFTTGHVDICGSDASVDDGGAGSNVSLGDGGVTDGGGAPECGDTGVPVGATTIVQLPQQDAVTRFDCGCSLTTIGLASGLLVDLSARPEYREQGVEFLLRQSSCRDLDEICSPEPTVLGRLLTSIENVQGIGVVSEFGIVGILEGIGERVFAPTDQCIGWVEVDWPDPFPLPRCSFDLVREFLPNDGDFVPVSEELIRNCLRRTVALDSGLVVVEQPSALPTFNSELDQDYWPEATSCIIEALSEQYKAGEADDTDGDRVCDLIDNCPDVADFAQADNDGDGVGDACDLDDDDDGISDADEVAVGLSPMTADSDGDYIPDGVEWGLDGPAHSDSLLRDGSPNPGADGIPDALDPDSDGDGLLDSEEAGDQDLNTPPVITGLNGIPDYQDYDRDNDGAWDASDNCPSIPNDSQEDLDSDGVGDPCDDDDDGDSVVDSDDLCPRTPNPIDPATGQVVWPQPDDDSDGVGNWCEPVVQLVFPTGDPVNSPNAGNELTFSTDNPGVLTITLRAELVWDELRPTDEVVMSPVSVGDSNCESSDAVFFSTGPSTWEVWSTTTCTGLPTQATAFGRKSARLRVLRAGQEIARTSTADFEVFWPLVNDRASPLHSENEASNHPASHIIFDEQTLGFGTNGMPVAWAGDGFWVPRPMPNWLYYWAQLPLGGDPAYIQQTQIAYAVAGHPNMNLPLPISAFPVGAFWNSPNHGEHLVNNILYVTPQNTQATWRDQTTASRIKYLHISLIHEFQHFQDHINWSREAFGVVVTPGDLHDLDSWIWYAANGFDFDGDDSVSVFSQCDLNADGVIADPGETVLLLATAPPNLIVPVPGVREAEIRLDCNGLPEPFGMSVNSDEVLSSIARQPGTPFSPQTWEVDEWLMENFDDDRDGLPDWHDLSVFDRARGKADRTAEDTADAPAKVFATQNHSNDIAPLNWSDPGDNHAP